MGDTWKKKDDTTPGMLWMAFKMSKQLREKITSVKGFNIIEETVEKKKTKIRKIKIGLHLE